MKTDLFRHRLGLRAACAGVLAMALLPAQAADFSIGLGAAASHGRGRCVDSQPCDRGDSAAKVVAGYRPTEAFELQAVAWGGNRFRGGDMTPLGSEFGGRFEVGGIGLTAGYVWSFAPAWSLVGRAGVASVRTKFDYAQGGIDSVSDTRAQPLLGLRLAYRVTPRLDVGIDYDLTRFKVHTSGGRLQMLGLAAQLSF